MSGAKLYIKVKLTEYKVYQNKYLVNFFTEIGSIISKLLEKIGFSTHFLSKY